MIELNSKTVESTINGTLNRVHVPWPTATLGTYGAHDNTVYSDEKMEVWVRENIRIPKGVVVIGVCPGRAHLHGNLTPCVVVTLCYEGGVSERWLEGRPQRPLNLGHCSWRDIWTDGSRAQ